MIIFDETPIDEAKKDKFDGNKKSRPINSKDYIKILRKLGYRNPEGTTKTDVLIKMCKLDNAGKQVPGTRVIIHHLKGHKQGGDVTPDMQREDVETFIMNGDIDPENTEDYGNPNFPKSMYGYVETAYSKIKQGISSKRVHVRESLDCIQAIADEWSHLMSV